MRDPLAGILLLLVALIMGATPATAASCRAPGDGLETALTGTGSGAIFFTDRPAPAICVKSSRCTWDVPLPSLDVLGSFADQIGDAGCPATIENREWRGKVYVSNCQMSSELQQALTATVELSGPMLGSTPCGTEESPLENHAAIAVVDGVPVFVGSVQMENYCLAVGLQLTAPNRVFAGLVRNCPADAAGAEAVAKQWFDAASGKYSLGASFETGFFGYTDPDAPFDLAQAAPVVAGNLETPYVTDWLAAIKRSAGLTSVGLSSDAPLAASDSSAIGRLANWLAAGLSRLDVRPFDSTDPNWEASVPARDWMARTFLSSPDQFAGTVLRAEKARTDGVPE